MLRNRCPGAPESVPKCRRNPRPGHAGIGARVSPEYALQRFLQRLRQSPIDRIVAITFTRKAAAELSDRLARVLRAIAGVDRAPEPRLLELYGPYAPDAATALRALEQIDTAFVSTVDSFLLWLVQQYMMDAYLPLPQSAARARASTAVAEACAWIDAPLEGGADTAEIYQSVAREHLDRAIADERCPEHATAREILAELSLGEAIVDLAALASTAVPRLWLQERAGGAGPAACPGLGELLTALGAKLAPRVKRDSAAWQNAFLAERHQDDRSKAIAAEWCDAPSERPGVAVLFCLGALRDESLIALRDRALAEAFQAIGWPPLAADAPAAWAVWGHRQAMQPWLDAPDGDAAVKRADRLRAALAVLAPQVRADAWRALAREGRLGYDEMLSAATALCLAAPPLLRERFDALLVDELQDTNPSQLTFYRAFASMVRPGGERIESFFVGDARQSIYRFRHADPHGWRELVTEADEDGALADLTTNYRSSALLVAAHRKIVAALRGQDEHGVDDLAQVSARPDAPEGMLRSKKWQKPLLVVDDVDDLGADERALVLFAERLREQWTKAPSETAAVLVRSWAKAAAAAEQLRNLGIDAQLTGDRALLGSRIAHDLRIFVQALLDPSDDVAVAAMLKHPSIGLSEQGLLTVCRAGRLSRLFGPSPPLAELEPGDRGRLERTLPILESSRRRLGREPTAALLERLIAELEWRPLIHAGPEGDGGVGLAQLDILLDLVREQEAERVDPQSVVEMLEAADLETADVPVVRMHGREQVVTITTVFGAKGLEFDHVCLIQLPPEGSGGVISGKGYSFALPNGVPVLGAKLDPTGGLWRAADPLAMLGSALCAKEQREEGQRLFYVGLTRAKRSVTFGLGAPTKGGGSPIDVLRTATIDNGDLAAEMVVVKAADVKLPPRVPTARGRTRRLRQPEARWADSRGHTMLRPAVDAGLAMDAKAVVQAFRDQARIVVGKSAPKRPDIEGLENVPAAVWGELVHGWLARWRFDGEPKVEDAGRYLSTDWSTNDSRLAEWLCKLGLCLRDDLPGFGELLQHRLHFEMPLVGIEPSWLWLGRTDLLVELPNRELVIIDFKAGDKLPTADEIPSVGTYAPQLEAYRRLLDGARYRVVEEGLVFVNGPSWVRVAYA